MSDPTSWDFSRFSGGAAGPNATGDAPRIGEGSAQPSVGTASAHSAGTGFADSAPLESPDAATTVSSPVGWLLGGIGVALLSAAAALVLGSEPLPAVVAWVFAGPVAIGLLAVYLLLDTRRRTQQMYSPPTWAPLLYRGGLIVVLLAVIACAARIALWAGRVWQL